MREKNLTEGGIRKTMLFFHADDIGKSVTADL